MRYVLPFPFCTVPAVILWLQGRASSNDGVITGFEHSSSQVMTKQGGKSYFEAFVVKERQTFCSELPLLLHASGTTFYQHPQPGHERVQVKRAEVY